MRYALSAINRKPGIFADSFDDDFDQFRSRRGRHLCRGTADDSRLERIAARVEDKHIHACIPFEGVRRSAALQTDRRLEAPAGSGVSC